ncbi:MAG: hypothetical protein N2506_02890 [Dehalococcoidales bacterium]|nr:hypothetical protein [Dehalococcoidales bacterium]
MKKVVIRRVVRRRPYTLSGGEGQPRISRLVDQETASRFNPSLLNLGDTSQPCEERDAVTAVFDLTGFTSFCNQVDAHLAIPRFLSEFLAWFFDNLKTGLTAKDTGKHLALWADFPAFLKFMGDGVLIIWYTDHLDERRICRIIAMLYDICARYQQEFYPRISQTIHNPPAVLRCGLARGKVFGIGGGKDFVGHCINNATRLSHLKPFSFCFPQRGFPVKEHLTADYLSLFTLVHIPVRGVGNEEPVWVLRKEMEKLSSKGNSSVFPQVTSATGNRSRG